MAIDAQTVKDLRDKTGLPMMKCKAALTETNGDAEKAIELLRKEGLKASDKRSDRENNEGIILTHHSDLLSRRGAGAGFPDHFHAVRKPDPDQSQKFLIWIFPHFPPTSPRHGIR